jgi:hypothetical protein
MFAKAKSRKDPLKLEASDIGSGAVALVFLAIVFGGAGYGLHRLQKPDGTQGHRLRNSLHLPSEHNGYNPG